MTNKQQLYWALQFGGWTIYTLVNYLSLPLFDMKLPYSGVYYILSGIIGIAVTHFYRLVIKEYKWFQKNILKLVGSMILGAIVITVIYFIFLTLIDAILFVFAFFIFNIQIDPPTISSDTYWAYFYLSLINVYAVFLLWSLLYFIFQYFENFQKAKYAQVIIQSQLKDATLLNLRNQINPHFLFNALNSIRALTLSDTQKAREAVTLLSEILRYSLNSEKKTFVTLEEEISVVKDYLELEKIRFGDRLYYTINVDEKTKVISVPPLVIMTLVENAIKHGISQLKNGGTISIGSSIQQDRLLITISNSGHLNQTQSDSGIGLHNTRQRLTMLFNRDARFEILQENEDTVTATIQIPITI